MTLSGLKDVAVNRSCDSGGFTHAHVDNNNKQPAHTEKVSVKASLRHFRRPFPGGHMTNERTETMSDGPEPPRAPSTTSY